MYGVQVGGKDVTVVVTVGAILSGPSWAERGGGKKVHTMWLLA